jgi:isocitrate dehydrogenase kinase/phosphatase
MTEEFDRYEDHLAKSAMRPAKGISGYLIRVLDDFMFRVYHDNKTYTDYTIMHYDLEVTITDPDAVFDNLQETLDYAP